MVPFSGVAGASAAFWYGIRLYPARAGDRVLRVAHAVVFWFGWPYVRTLAFAVSWFTLLYMAWQVLG